MVMMKRIGEMVYAVYDKRGKVVIITSDRKIAEYYANDCDNGTLPRVEDNASVDDVSNDDHVHTSD